MVSFSRRSVLQLLSTGAIVGFAGCIVDFQRDRERHPRLRISPNVDQTETGWQMEVRVKHTSDTVTSIHDVTVIAFDNHGREVCQLNAGDFPRGGRHEATETTDCDDFPAIVTATAEESPCDGANIQIVYWTGSEEERFPWDDTFRECDESLPPGRVLDEVKDPPKDD